jgi:hypothetical protein
LQSNLRLPSSSKVKKEAADFSGRRAIVEEAKVHNRL